MARECSITREQFKAAESIVAVIAGRTHVLEPKDFSTGSFGWGLNAKQSIDVDGVSVDVQIGMNITIIGSKRV